VVVDLGVGQKPLFLPFRDQLLELGLLLLLLVHFLPIVNEETFCECERETIARFSRIIQFAASLVLCGFLPGKLADALLFCFAQPFP